MTAIDKCETKCFVVYYNGWISGVVSRTSSGQEEGLKMHLQNEIDCSTNECRCVSCLKVLFLLNESKGGQKYSAAN